jgi:hypothetical protein
LLEVDGAGAALSEALCGAFLALALVLAGGVVSLGAVWAKATPPRVRAAARLSERSMPSSL